jgi:hypothetical protein
MSDFDNIGYIEDVSGTFEEEMAQAQKDLGLAGIGAAAAPAKAGGRPKGKIPSASDTGDLVVWGMGATSSSVSVAAAASSTITFTPNRNISIRDIFLIISAAAADVAKIPCAMAAVYVTSIVVQGREQTAGTGRIPIGMFDPNNPLKTKFVFDNCQAGQSVVVSFTNGDAATTFLVSGAMIVTTIR